MECLVFMEKTLQTQQQELGKDDERLAEAKYGLGVLHRKQGRYSEAKKILKQVHRIYTRLHGDCKKLSRTCCHLGIIYERMGQFSKSLQMHEDALRM